MVEMFGLKKPVPMMVKEMPMKKNSFGSTAITRLPTIISAPPQNSDLLEAEDLVREQPADEGEGVDEGLDRAVLQVGHVLRHHAAG